MPKDIKRKGVRVSRDAVTGEVSSEAIGPVEEAFARCTQVIEGKMLSLSNGDVHRLAAKLADWLARMQPHFDGEN